VIDRPKDDGVEEPDLDPDDDEGLFDQIWDQIRREDEGNA